jgi:hypothetical protein
MPSWQQASAASLESAAVEERPVVVYFPDENDSDFELYGEEFNEISTSSAVFVKIPYTEDRAESPWEEETVVPTSRLLSENPAREYDVKVGDPTVLVCDWHGNEYFRTDERVRPDALKKMIEKVADEVEDANDKLQKYFDKAKEEYDEGDVGKAIKYLLKNFDDGEGPVGLPAQEESIRLYHEIMDNARAKMEELVEAGDVDGLKDLEKEVKKTPLEDEIEDAVSELK